MIKRHERFKYMGGWRKDAMDVTPAQHVLIVIRERLSGYLQGDGCSEEAVLYADKLARAFWTGRTLDVVLTDLRFILDSSEYASILGWCKTHYPITFLTILPKLREVDQSVFGPFHPANADRGGR